MKNFTTERVIPTVARVFVGQIVDLEAQMEKNSSYVRMLESAFTVAYMTEYAAGNSTMNSVFWEELQDEVAKREEVLQKQQETERIRETILLELRVRELTGAHQPEPMDTSTTPKYEPIYL